MHLKLSIILPIYNVELFLEKCIRSLENQDISKESYEIICVNDGSPDNCLGIIKILQNEYSNIILIDQENQGVSVARNNGIKIAKGEYIFFVDPDDAIDENCLKNLLDYADINGLEIVYSPLTFVEMNGEENETRFDTNKIEILEGLDLYFVTRGMGIIDPDRSYAILYKRDFIVKNSLYYLKDIPYLEDGEFIARVFCLTKKAGIYNTPYYLRLNRPGSATKSDLIFQMRSIKGFLLAASNLKEFQDRNNLDLSQKKFMNQPISKFVLLAVRSAISSRSLKKFLYVKHELKKSNMKKLNLDGNMKKFIEMGKIYNISIYIFVLYWMKESYLKTLKK